MATRAPGFLRLDARQKPIFYNAEAERILNFSLNGRAERAGKDGVAAAVRAILSRRKNAVAGSSTGVPEILSGRRRYYWQTFSVFEKTGKRSPKITESRAPETGRDAKPRARIPLDQSRGETVSQLKLRLTSKEIAERMQVSPNTVKVFLRSIMSKMSVSTRGNPGKGAAVLYEQRPGSPRAYCIFLENGNSYALYLIAVRF